MRFFANLVIRSMSEKLRSRVKFHSSFSEIDIIDQKDLPVEVGGETNTMELISENRLVVLFVR